MTLPVTLAIAALLSLSAIALYSTASLDVMISGNKRRHTQAKIAAQSGLSHFMSLDMHADEVRTWLAGQERARILDRIEIGDGKTYYTVDLKLVGLEFPDRFYVISTGTLEKGERILSTSSLTATVQTLD